jgi:protein involved in polysaccharide export with SLBB domain
VEKRSVLAFFVASALVLVRPVQAQEPMEIPNVQVQIAISSPSYPVTSGDVYSLSYMAGGTAVSYLITVDASYRIKVSNLAVIDVAGKTYPALKREAETIVSNNYPLSGVQLTMIKPSSFTVYIKGEVNSAGERTTWAMGRLSSLVSGAFSAYSSTRNITVTSASGRVKTCDLFKAQRFGDMSEDPYMRPGDVITVNHLDRKVSIHGEVERPGAYELLPGENIRELIRDYANGYTARADAAKVGLRRYEEGGLGLGNIIYLTPEEINANHPLHNFDVVYVLSK